jgi:hypothetical protein
MAKTKNKIPEGKLLKALAELEDAVEKSDPLADADPEGGFSTEGTPLSAKAPSGKSDAKKSAAASSSDSSSDDDDDTAKAFSASDMMSPKEKKKAKKDKTEKSFPPKKDDSDDDSSSDDASSDDGDDTEKSLRDIADQDETMSKAIEVSDFLEAMVDQVSLTLLTMTKSFQKAIGEMESRINARIDNRVAKSIGMTGDFNARLAKAITAIGTSVEEQADLVKSLQNAPAAPRGKALLSKSDVNQPPWGAGGTTHEMANGSDLSELTSLPADKVGDWLFAKSASNKIDPKLILAWEANRYDVTTLPEEIQKSLANDLLK